MRHADSLLLQDYKALEIEKMKQIDKINPRILRYLGYSAYYNDNVDVAIKSLQDYTSIPTNNVISLDYLYLGLSYIKKATIGTDVTVAEPMMFNKGIELQKQLRWKKRLLTLNAAGKGLYEQNFTKRQISKSLPQIRNLKICLTISI
jgi:hypothetical protein